MDAVPASIDLQDFQFKLHSKLKLFDTTDETKYKNATNLVAAASRYGLVFIGSSKPFLEVVLLKSIEISNATKNELTDFPKRSVPLISAPTHFSLNCDHTLLSVIIIKDGCAVAVIYNVSSFLSYNVIVVREIRISATPGVTVVETNWNPAMPTVFTACKSDGSLGVYHIQETTVDINEIPAMARATCFCWSPKGKQIVVGSMDGNLTQYKPDLKAVKAVPTPPLQGVGPFVVLNVCWLTNYQFVAVYKDAGEEESRAVILIVNAPKTGPVTYINYDDVCYSYGSLRATQFYIIHQPVWGILLVASANSMEVGVLGVAQPGEPAVWQQWNQIDTARAELPLTQSRHQETFPIGFAFDTGVTLQLPWGENQTLPPMPMIHILSHHGVLCSFSVINIRQGAVPLCVTPEQVADQSGLSQFAFEKQITTSASVASAPNIPATTMFNSPPASSNQIAQPVLQFGSNFQVSTPPLVSATSSVSLPVQKTPSSSIVKPTPTTTTPMYGLSMATTPLSFTGTVTLASAPTMSSTVSKPMFDLTTTSAPIFPTLNLTPKTTVSTPVASSPMFVAPKTKPVVTNPKDTPPLNITPVTKIEEPSLNDKTVHSLIKEELKNFRSELKELLHRCKAINVNVGTEDEKENLVTSTDYMMEFYEELQETTDSQVAEVHYLKQALIQSFAWYEDAKARHKRYTDPNLAGLLQLYDLDPVSEKQLVDIKHLVYYIEAQLKQVHSFLDNQWAEFQDSCKKQVKEKIRYPTLEPIYQSLLRQNAIVDKQRYVLKDISARIKSRNLTSSLYPHALNLTNLNTKPQLIESFQKLTIEPEDIFANRYDKIVTNQQKFTETKQSKLCSFFTNRNVVHISPKKPNFSTSLLLNLSKKSPSAQRSLQFDLTSPNSTADPNLSASNLFSFTLLDGVQPTKLPSPEKTLLKPIVTQSKTTSMFSGATPTSKSFANAFNFNSAPPTTSVFSFTAPSSISNKPQMFTSKPSLSIGSNLIQTKPAFTSDAKVEPKQTEVTLIKPSAIKTLPVVPQTKIEPESSASEGTIPTFSFGSSLTLNQQSTPKSKAVTTTVVSPLTFIATPNSIVSPPVAASKSTVTTPIVAPKPAYVVASPSATPGINFNFVAPSLTTTPTSNSVVITPVTSKQVIPTFVSPTVTVTCANSTSTTTSTFGTSFPSSTFGQLSSSSPFISASSANVGVSTTTLTPNFTENLFKTSPLTSASSIAIVSTTPVVPAFTETMFKASPTTAATGNAIASTTPVAPAFTETMFKTSPGTYVPAAVSTTLAFTGNLFETAPATSVSAAVSTTAFTGNLFKTAPATSVSTPSSFTGNLFKTASTTSVSNIFGAVPVTNMSQATTLESSTVTSSSFSFIKPDVAAEPSKSVSIFGGMNQSLFGTTPAFNFLQPSVSTSNTKPVETTSTATRTVETTKILEASSVTFDTKTVEPSAKVVDFDTVATTKPVEVTSTSFSIKSDEETTKPVESTITFGAKPFETVNTMTGTRPVETVSTGFGIKPLETVSTGFSTKQTENTEADTAVFGTTPIGANSAVFGTKSVEASTTIFGAKPEAPATTFKAETNESPVFKAVSTSDNTFSFGNLTVSALSPSASAAKTVTSAETFTFALPSETSATPTGFNSTDVFGKPAVTMTTSNFMGQPICSPSTFSQNTGSIFGQSTGNIFAQTSTTATTNTNLFGQNSTSIFGGGSNTAVTSQSMFGQSGSLPFGSSANTAPVFGQTSAFGAPSSTTTEPVFGQSAFGRPVPATTSFSFIQNANTSPGFGNTSGNIFGAKPAFGQQPAFGQAPAFGAPPAFGAMAQTGSIFGGGTNTTQNAGTFGSSFGSPPAFGQKPTFGSPPAFGQGSFGSPPAFGSSPSFGSPERVFGSPGTSPTGGTFGSAIQDNATFANLANQSTLGFGSLAQNQATASPPQPPQFSGGAQFSSWR